MGWTRTRGSRIRPPLSFPYYLDTSRPSFRTNWTRLVPPSVLGLPRARTSRAARWTYSTPRPRSLWRSCPAIRPQTRRPCSRARSTSQGSRRARCAGATRSPKPSISRAVRAPERIDFHTGPKRACPSVAPQHAVPPAWLSQRCAPRRQASRSLSGSSAETRPPRCHASAQTPPTSYTSCSCLRRPPQPTAAPPPPPRLGGTCTAL